MYLDQMSHPEGSYGTMGSWGVGPYVAHMRVAHVVTGKADR